MTDHLKNLPRLGDQALGPCASCGKLMLETGPIFYRVTVKQCGIDAKAVQRHVGLGMMLGGGEAGLALAAVMGPQEKPVVVINESTANICLHCATEGPSHVLDVLADPVAAA